MARFSSNVSIYIGIAVSIALALQLAHHVMSSGVGAEITFIEFVTIPANLFYISLRVCLCMAFWIMNGVNNRTYVILWVIGDLLSALMFWNGLQVFLNEHKNIYVLNFLAAISLIPLYCLCRFRVLMLFSLFWCLQRLDFLTHWASAQQKRLTITKVTTNLDMWLSILMAIEIAFALLFSVVSLHFKRKRA